MQFILTPYCSNTHVGDMQQFHLVRAAIDVTVRDTVVWRAVSDCYLGLIQTESVAAMATMMRAS